MPAFLLALLKPLSTIFANKWLYVALVAAIALFSTGRLIYNHVYESGKADTIAIYQPKLDKFNAEAIARNAKISDLEQTAAEQAQQIISLSGQLAAESLTSETDFVAANPELALQCAVEKPTVDAYNRFLTQALIKR